MRNKLVLLIAALVLSLACTSQAIVVGDFEGGFDGWQPAGASTLTLSTTGATSGTESVLIEGPGSWQMLAKLDIKSLRATLGVADAAVSIDVTALVADMVARPFWMNMEVIINGQNNDSTGAHNNIGWQSLGALNVVRNGAAQTLRWEVPDDLAAKIAGTDDNIQWFELFIVTNNAATNTKIYVDNIQLLGTEPQPPAGPKIIWVSFHGADDAPSAGAAGDGFTEAPDKGYTDLLKANGYDVTRYIQTSTPDVNVLNAADLVIVSRSVGRDPLTGSMSFQNAAATAWNGISAPMIFVSEIIRAERLGFVTGNTYSHIKGDITLTVNDPNHPIFTGISLTNGTMTNPYAGVVMYPDGTKAHGMMIVTDAPNANGTVLATVSAAGNGPAGVMIIGEWPAGATVTHDGGAPATDVLAGHRLVFQTSSCTPSGKNWETAGMYDLYPDGAKLFLNAVKYMIPAKKIVWVSRHGADDAPSAGAAAQGFTEAPDKGYTDLLKANGYDVTRYIGTVTPDVNVLNAADLVIIGRNNDAYGHYHYSNGGATTWNGISAPMIIMHGYTLQTCCMGYTTGGTMGQNMVDTTGDITLTVNDPNHPIFAGIPLTAGTMTNPYAGLAVYPTDGTTVTGGISIDTDPLNGGGTVLATVSSAGNGPVGGTVIAEWPAGAMLMHGTEPGTDTLGGHRLVFLTGARQASGKSVHTAGIYDLSADGAQMFLNAVQYMLK